MVKPSKFLLSLIILLIIMPVMVLYSSEVQATTVKGLTCAVNFVGCVKFILTGTVQTAEVKVEQGFEYRKKGSAVWLKAKYANVSVDSISAHIAAQPSTTYEARTYLIYKNRLNQTFTIYSSLVTARTKAYPTVNMVMDNRSSSTALFYASVITNGNTIGSGYYRLYSQYENPAADPVNLFLNFSTDSTIQIYLEGLEPATEYSIRIVLYTEDMYEFKTTFLHFSTKSVVTATPKPSPTVTPTPSPTPAPTPTAGPTSTPKPTPTATPKTTVTPKPTSTETSSQSTTESSSPVETSQTAANTPTPEPTAAPTTTSPPVETTLPAETTPATTETQETTPEPTQPQGNDNGEFPWTVLIVALVAIAGIGFGVGGVLMIAARKKK